MTELDIFRNQGARLTLLRKQSGHWGDTFWRLCEFSSIFLCISIQLLFQQPILWPWEKAELKFIFSTVMNRFWKRISKFLCHKFWNKSGKFQYEGCSKSFANRYTENTQSIGIWFHL